MKENMLKNTLKHIAAPGSFFPHQSFQYLGKRAKTRARLTTKEMCFQNTHELELPATRSLLSRNQ